MPVLPQPMELQGKAKLEDQGEVETDNSNIYI